jgi:hypothetical protein
VTERKGYAIIPRDGLRNRFSVITKDTRYNIALDRDGFLVEEAVHINKTLDRIQFTLENRSGNSHKTILNLFSLTASGMEVVVDRKELDVRRTGKTSWLVEIPVSLNTLNVEIVIK